MSAVPCRCLLRETPGGRELYESVQALIAGLPPEERTPHGEYAARLAACKDCPWLTSGTCMQCGCFVEARAARREMHCPAPRRAW